MAHDLDRVWPGNPTGTTRAERSSCRYRPYVPDALTGRPIALGGQQSADVADAERALLELGRDHPGLVNLEALARLLLRAEAVASSYIEGLRINVRRLLKEEIIQRAGIAGRDETARAVLGNVRAMETAVTLADAGRPIQVDEVLALHDQLLAGTRDEAYGGRLRTDQNWVGGTGLSPCTAEYVPPPPELVSELMEDLCAYLSSDDHPATVQAALAHAQFETIHPFADGNGRTGRALIHVVLRRRGLAPRFVPPISLVLATHADDYIRSLTAYRYDGAADSRQARDGTGAWIDRFLADTLRACGYAREFAEELEKLEGTWRVRVGRIRAGSATDRLLAALPTAPVLTAATAAELVGRSEARVGDAIRRLVDAGVLRQITVGRRNRAFEAPELLAAVTGFERVLASPAGDTQLAPPVRPAPARP